jgi:hypothetical protein
MSQQSQIPCKEFSDVSRFQRIIEEKGTCRLHRMSSMDYNKPLCWTAAATLLSLAID